MRPAANVHGQMNALSVDRRASEIQTPPPSTGWRKAIQLTLAGLCFTLGIIGAILPGLPTTPFLLLTSGLLLRCSPRLNALLLRSRFFGPVLRDWQVHRGVRADVKAKAVCGVLIAVGATLYFAQPAIWPKVILLTAAPIGIAVIAKLPTASVPHNSSDQHSGR